MFGPMMGAGRDYQRAAEEVNRQQWERVAGRKQKLAPIIEALKKIKGVEAVQQDDFDSTGFNVCVYLHGTKYKLAERLQDTKRRIRNAINEFNVGFLWVDQPVKMYSNKGMVGEKPTDQGYNHRMVMVDIKC